MYALSFSKRLFPFGSFFRAKNNISLRNVIFNSLKTNGLSKTDSINRKGIICFLKLGKIYSVMKLNWFMS